MVNPGGVIRLFAEHKVACNMLMVVMVLLGIWGLQHINTQLNPNQTFNYIEVNITWPGASAEDVERLITKPVEYQLRTLDNVRELTSTTRNGSTGINLEFTRDAEISRALDEVKQALEQVRDLPSQMEPPVVRQYTFNELVAAVLITGSENISELIPLVKQYERELIRRGIDKVVYRALPEEEIAIQIDSLTLVELGMSLDRIAENIAAASKDAPAGTAGHGQSARQLRSLDQQRDVNGFEQLPVLGIGAGAGGQLVQLGDIAHIEQRPRDNQVQASQNGRAAIVMRVLRTPGTDTLQAAKILKQWHRDISNNLQAQQATGIEVKLFLEAWLFAKDQINLVMKNGLGGLVLVVCALFLFLNGRVAWWVMLGIPISFLAALAMFYCWGGTINFLSMIGLVMALGIVVDDAIVVGEHSLTQFESGSGPLDAAAGGAQRMLAPVMASSLTTLAAFIPLLVVDSDSVREIPMIMVCVIVASIIECFLIMPGHLRGSFSRLSQARVPVYRQKFERQFERFRDRWFMPVLKLALKNRRAALCAALAMMMFACSLLASGRIKPELNLNVNFEYIEAGMQFAAEASEAEKSAYLAELERTMIETEQALGGGIVVTHVNYRGMAYLDREYKRGDQYNNMLVELVSPEQRHVSLDEFTRAWRERVAQPPWVEYLQLQSGDEFQSDFSLYLQGRDTSTLKAAAEELKATLGGYPGVSNVYDDLPYGREQWIFSLTAQGRELGLTASLVGRQLYAAFEGYRIQSFNRGGREIEVRVKLPDRERFNPLRLNQFPIATPGGEMVPLASVAHIESRRGIDVIQHNNAQLAVNVRASVDKKINTPLAVLANLEKKVIPTLLDKYDLQYGLSGGSADERRVARDLLMGAVISLVLIYIVLAWVFASYLWPLAVMLAIPLGLTGALLGLQLLGMNLGVMSILGLFTLSGVIVNDSIILVTAFKEYRHNGMGINTALEKAVHSRLRAVILTSLTTSLGLAPMLFETSPMGEVMAPLAVVICCGILYGSLLILIVIPALLSMLETLALNRRRTLSKSRVNTCSATVAVQPPANNRSVVIVEG